MKKSIIIVILLLGLSLPTWACNVCGGSSGGSYLGILPQYYKNFVGIRYSSKSFSYKSYQPSTIGSGKLNSESFNTVELWGRFYPLKQLQVFYFIPYSVNSRFEENRSVQIQGIGDASVVANYTILNRNEDSLRFKHFIMVGGGLKLPTGKYQQRDANKTMFPVSFQVGTGSYAVQANLIYTVKYGKFGLNNDVSYKLPFENELTYKLGEQLNASSMLFYWSKISKNAVFLPQIGVFAEKFEKDKQYEIVRRETGGHNVFINFGADLYYKKVIAGVTFMEPLVSEVPSALPSARTRLLFNVSYLF